MTKHYILSVVITMFTVVDPFGLIPVFLGLADRFERKKQRSVIIKAFIVACLIASFFLFFGKHLFSYLEVTYNAIYIVGGILLFLIGLEMIYAKPRSTRTSEKEKEEALSHEDVSIFPLAIPMLSGPGTIATIIMFSSRSPDMMNQFLVLGATIFAFICAALCMFFSVKLISVLGQTGLNVIGRIMGMILCCMAVQFIINAVTAVLGIAPCSV